MDVDARRRLGQHLSRLAAGDRSAFDEVFGLLWPALRALSVRLLGDGASAEDTAQEALMKVLGRIDEYDPARDALSWAFAITAFEARTVRKRTMRRRETDDGSLATAPALGADPEGSLVDAEIRFQIASAVDLLSEVDRAEIELYLGLAEADGPIGAAQRKRRQRALDRLKLIWRRLHGFHA